MRWELILASTARQSYFLAQYCCNWDITDSGAPCDHASEAGRSIPGGMRAVDTRSVMKERRSSETDILNGVGSAILTLLFYFSIAGWRLFVRRKRPDGFVRVTKCERSQNQVRVEWRSASCQHHLASPVKIPGRAGWGAAGQYCDQTRRPIRCDGRENERWQSRLNSQSCNSFSLGSVVSSGRGTVCGEACEARAGKCLTS